MTGVPPTFTTQAGRRAFLHSAGGWLSRATRPFFSEHSTEAAWNAPFLAGNEAFHAGNGSLPTGSEAFLAGNAAFAAGNEAFPLGNAAFPRPLA